MKKSEWHRYWTERMKVGQPARAQPAAPHGGDARAAHNESERAGRHAAYAYEESAGRPSRKSSRKGANRQKTDVQFRNKVRTSEGRPPSEGR